jgi:hypothetical protein
LDGDDPKVPHCHKSQSLAIKKDSRNSRGLVFVVYFRIMPASIPKSAFPVDIIHNKKEIKFFVVTTLKNGAGAKKVYAVVATCVVVVRKCTNGRKFTTNDLMCCVKLAAFWSQSQFAIQVYKMDADCKKKVQRQSTSEALSQIMLCH